MPDLSHLWQRFVLAAALIFGLAVGVGATVFAYSNTAPVNLGWSIFHLNSVPLWSVALVPIALILVAGTLFHWFNSLHHFTEHMRHRRRVHELEAEVKSLRSHLDSVLQMPGHEETASAGPAAEPEPVTSPNGEEKAATTVSAKELEPVAVPANGSAGVDETETDTAPEIAPTAGS